MNCFKIIDMYYDKNMFFNFFNLYSTIWKPRNKSRHFFHCFSSMFLDVDTNIHMCFALLVCVARFESKLKNK